MSTATVTDLVQLAKVDSANLHVDEALGAPVAVLEVVAQSSGFNWELKIHPAQADHPFRHQGDRGDRPRLEPEDR